MQMSEHKKALILSGDPAKDFPAFLRSKEKPFDMGVELIRRHTSNTTLVEFLEKIKDEPRARKILIDNLKIIARKWSKK